MLDVLAERERFAEPQSAIKGRVYRCAVLSGGPA